MEDAFSKVAGNPAKPLFESYVYGVQTPDYKNLFNEFGFTWSNTNEGKSIPYLGFTAVAGKIISVYRGASAYMNGLNVGDEIVSVNKANFEGLDKLLADKKWVILFYLELKEMVWSVVLWCLSNKVP